MRHKCQEFNSSGLKQLWDQAVPVPRSTLQDRNDNMLVSSRLYFDIFEINYAAVALRGLRAALLPCNRNHKDGSCKAPSETFLDL